MATVKHDENDLDARGISEIERYQEVLPEIRAFVSAAIPSDLMQAGAIDIDGDAILLGGGYSIYLDRRRLTIESPDDLRWVWVLGVEAYYAGDRWNPPECDLIDISTFNYVLDAVARAALSILEDDLRNRLEGGRLSELDEDIADDE